MAMSPGLILVLVLLLSCGHLNASPHKSCPDFCTCQPSLQLNCSSAGLFVAPTNIDTSISELDLSNNQLGSLTFQSKYHNLHKLWLGNNSMPHLSLCVDMGLKGQSTSRLRRSCVLWAPTLQLLSVQRNQLQKLPQGLGQQRSLQVLLIAFNNISTLEQKDFFHLEQLEELDLQHNLISSLHPRIFEKLYRLKHLDLSFNLLTTIHPVTYMTLQHIGADVAITGNRWICDCRMSFLQRQSVHGNSKSLKMWFIECASPLPLSVKNLQDLDKESLDCQDSNIHQEVSVLRGSTTRLPCSNSDAVWWTPIGRATKGQQQGSLLISNITEPSEGLYICLSTSLQILSSYYVHIHDQNNVHIHDQNNVHIHDQNNVHIHDQNNVHIHDQNRRIRSVADKNIPLIQNKMPKIEPRVSQSNFDMAVSLSVIITFIIAFILGVFLQPYICACWQKNKTRKKKPQTNSVPNVHQEQYVNDAYLHCEDVDDIESHRERRVTFSEYAEEGDMQYYDAVAGDVQESNGAVTGPVQANFTKKIEFEIIQNSAERNSLSSQSSKSSISNNILKENCSTPNTTQVIKEHIQKATPIVQTNTTERSNEIPGFVSEPFADWSPHENTTIAHSDLDNGEPFEYSDSVRSGSPISPNSSFKQTNVNVQNIHKDTSFTSSSSSSVMSDSEPTHYIVNTDSEEEGDVFVKTVSIQSSSNSDIMTETNLTVETWPVVDLEYIPAIKRRLIFKTAYVDSYSTGIAKESELQLKQTYPIIEQNLSTIKKRKAPLPPPRKSSSSSSDNGMDTGEFKEGKVQVETKPDLKVVQLEQQSPWPVVNLERVCKVKRSLHFKVQNMALKSLPSSESEDDRIYEEIIEVKPMGSKHVSGASSSSESDEEQEIKVVKQYQENTHQLTSPNRKSEERQLPVIHLAKIPKVKQRLEIKEKQELTHVKERLPSTISFSSEDEHETSEERDNYYETIQRVSSQKQQESQWPGIDLVQIPKVKRRLDLKTAKPAVHAESSDSEEEHIYENVQGNLPTGVDNVLRESDSSFSSDNEDDQQIKVIINQENLQQSTIGPTQQSQWPMINLVRIPKVKRRLDLKTVKPAVRSASSDSDEEHIYENVQGKLPIGVDNVLRESDSSFSSESEDDQKVEVTINQETVQPATSPINLTKEIGHNQESQWPMINLVTLPKVKRRLDIRGRVDVVSKSKPQEIAYVPKPDSGTSSSESEYKQEIREDHHQEKLQIITSPNTQSTGSQWPVINLAKIPSVKRRLDIKEKQSIQATQRVPSAIVSVSKPEVGSSSSSESEDEVHTENILETTSSVIPSTAIKPNQELQWPEVNLVKVSKVKRRLDIKTLPAVDKSYSRDKGGRIIQTQDKVVTQVNVQKPHFETYSSSESEDEKEIKNVTMENLQQIAPPTTITGHRDTQWPVINLKIPKVKRRLDIKERVPEKGTKSPQVATSPSIKIEKQSSKMYDYENIQQVTIPNKEPTFESESQWPVINLVRVPKLKRRLDIKPQSNPYSTSTNVTTQFERSSSSESEEEKEIIETKWDNTLVTSQNLQPAQSEWPSLDLVKIPKVNRRLDFKERENTIVTEGQERVPSVSNIIPKQDSNDNELPTIDFRWPMIDLVRLPKLKRRLDVKDRIKMVLGPSKLPYARVYVQQPESSSSSDSEEEQIIHVNQDNLQQSVTSTNKQQAQSQWPVMDLVNASKLKRRLDFKTIIPDLTSSTSQYEEVAWVQERVPSTKGTIPKTSLGTSSSSESEDETIQKLGSRVEPLTQWPVIDLVNASKLKRRLDFKTIIPDLTSSTSEYEEVAWVQERVPSTKGTIPKTSSSSESEDETIQKLGSRVEPLTQWPVMDLVNASKLKRRLDFKTTIPDLTSSTSEYEEVAWVQERVPSTKGTIPKTSLGTSSSSESEDETIQKLGSRVEPLTQWPVMDLRSNTQIKRRLDFKIKSQSLPLPVPSDGGSSNILVSSSSSIVHKSPQISAARRSPSQTSTGIPYISRRLDIKGPAISTSLNDSVSSSSDDEKDTPKPNGSVKSQDKHFIKVSPISTLTRSPTKTTPSIELENYTVVTDKFRDNTSSGSSSPVVTPELQSKWAGMNLGVSRFRRRLDVTKPNDLPPSPPPSSPKSDQFFTAIGTERVPIVPTREQNEGGFSRSESEDDSKLGKSSKSEVDSVPPQVSLTSIPHVKRSLNITIMQKNLTSSSSTDENTVGVAVPDLSQGVPRIKRRLHIKAPTPPPSSSSCDDEKVYAHTFSDVTDQRSIEYKRTIMKSTSYDSFSSNRDFYREPLYVESNRHTPKKLSLDNIKRKLMPSKQNELPPNLRWTSVGSHLSEHPIPTVRRQQDGYTSPTTVSLPHPTIKENLSDNSSRSEDEQNEVKTSLNITQKTYSPRSVTFNTSPIILNAAPEDRVEQKGLSALKVMSSDRKNWEYEYETFTESVPVSVDPPEVHNVYRRKVNINTKISQPQTYITVSPGLDEMRRAEMLYGIPSNKRLTITSTELPQGPPPPLPPPPVPSTPLPDESPSFAWRSPQSSLSRGSLGYVQKKTTEEESVDEPFYDSMFLLWNVGAK